MFSALTLISCESRDPTSENHKKLVVLKLKHSHHISTSQTDAAALHICEDASPWKNRFFVY